MHKAKSLLKNKTHSDRSRYPAKKTKRHDNNKKERTCWIVNFAVLVNHRVKFKENEERDQYLYFARELKKQWNMEVTVIPLVTSACRAVLKGFLSQRARRVENRRTSGDHLNYSIVEVSRGYWEESRKSEKICCHSANACVKNSPGIIKEQK